MLRTLGTALAALLLATPLAASAQDVPSYAYAPQAATADEQIRGRIASFDGAYDLTVNDERGFVDNVDLHDGTIINPTGLTLAPGMVVSILGYSDGSQFAANEIDTPYSYDAGVADYGGHPWDYYGPSTSLAFFFGSAGWWHGNAFRGDYSYRGGARYYNQVNVNNIVRNSHAEYNGVAYRSSGRVVAPRGNGAAFARPAAPAAPAQTQFVQRQPALRQPAYQPAFRQSRVSQPAAQQGFARPPMMRQAAPQQAGRQESRGGSAPRGESQGHGGRTH